VPADAGKPPRLLSIAFGPARLHSTFAVHGLPMQTQIVTDASTIAIFDLAALSHKIEAHGDWWTYECEDLLTELRNRNLYLINTGFDGKFAITISNAARPTGTPLNCPSGMVYVTCGEEIPGEGLTPELIRGGLRHPVPSGLAQIAHTQDGARITVHIWSEP